MKPRKTIDRFDTADGHFFELITHDNDWYIEIDGTELMSTRRTGSEIKLAELGCAGLKEAKAPRVLIGGLGFGYTARAALRELPGDAKLVVADLFEKVVEWNQTHLRGLYAGALEDKRFEIVVSDVWDQIGKGSWNSILLDTDNGPEFLCLPDNQRLYRDRGLERVRNALVPGGLLAVWSADAQPSFVKRMRSAGFDAECKIVRERGNKGQSYAIHIGRLPIGRRIRSATPGQKPRQRSQQKPRKGNPRRRSR